jgi:hypothetical protein
VRLFVHLPLSVVCYVYLFPLCTNNGQCWSRLILRSVTLHIYTVGETIGAVSRNNKAACVKNLIVLMIFFTRWIMNDTHSGRKRKHLGWGLFSTGDYIVSPVSKG